jgi:hypothetical protein
MRITHSANLVFRLSFCLLFALSTLGIAAQRVFPPQGKSQVAVSATTAVYDGLEILCALAPNTGLPLSDK